MLGSLTGLGELRSGQVPEAPGAVDRELLAQEGAGPGKDVACSAPQSCTQVGREGTAPLGEELARGWTRTRQDIFQKFNFRWTVSGPCICWTEGKGGESLALPPGCDRDWTAGALHLGPPSRRRETQER